MSRRAEMESRIPRQDDPRSQSPAEPEEQRAGLSLERLTPEAVLALQSGAGNDVVQRMLARSPSPSPPAPTAPAPALPSIAHLSPTAQSLLEGALEKTTIDEAVRQIYDNVFAKTGWTYNASVKDTSGASWITGGKTSGMCESYRNAFAEVLSIYNGLRPAHPDDAIKNGALNVVLGNALAPQRFATRKGLTLMGATALKGNVYFEVDGAGNVLDQGTDSLNTFVFLGHWTLHVNGKEYDPIFHSINGANVATLLDQEYSYGAGRFLANTSKPVSTGEFGSTFVHVTDYATFKGIVDDVATLYDDHTSDVEALQSGSKFKTFLRGVVRPKQGDVMKAAEDIFERRIADQTAFAEAVEAGYTSNKITRAQRKAFLEVSKLVA